MTDEVVDALVAAGFVAAEDEAAELVAAATSAAELQSMLARRLQGEPLAWIIGHVDFLGRRVQVDPGVYVPRSQTESLAEHAMLHLPAAGTAVDLCTGSGAIAAFLADRAPSARILATDVDRRAVRCAAANGVEALLGNLFDPLPSALRGRVDLVVAVAPYVPDAMFGFLPRDVVAYEPKAALSGGVDGLTVVGAIIDVSGKWLVNGGFLVLEVGIDQVEAVAERMADADFVVHELIVDGDGDRRGVCAARAQ